MRYFLFSSLTFIIIFLSACSSSNNLPEPTPLTSFKAKVSVKPVWSTQVQGTDGHHVVLTIAHQHGVLFIAGYNADITAVNAKTGKKIWRTALLNRHIIAGVTASERQLYLADDKGNIIDLRQADGVFEWQQQLGSQVLSQPTVVNGTVYTKTINDELYAIDAKTGVIKWHYVESAPTLILNQDSSPTVHDNDVIVGLSDGHLASFSTINGQLRWKQLIALPEGSLPVQRMNDITSTPLITSNSILAASYQGKIGRYSLTTGKTLWSKKLSVIENSLSSGKRWIVIDANDVIHCIAINSGEELWHQKQLTSRGLTAPTLSNNMIIVADHEGNVHWLSLQMGGFLARIKHSDAAIYARPIAANGLVYIVDSNGKLTAYQVKAKN